MKLPSQVNSVDSIKGNTYEKVKTRTDKNSATWPIYFKIFKLRFEFLASYPINTVICKKKIELRLHLPNPVVGWEGKFSQKRRLNWRQNISRTYNTKYHDMFLTTGWPGRRGSNITHLKSHIAPKHKLRKKIWPKPRNGLSLHFY